MSKNKLLTPESVTGKQKTKPIMVVIYIVCIFLALLSLFPFILMFMNATRASADVQANPIAILPGGSLAENYKNIMSRDFNPYTGFLNSIIVSVFSTILTCYFSTLTAYAIVVYDWKLKHGFYAFILAIMMVPNQVVSIGFFKLVFDIGLNNSLIPLIIPSIQAPMTVFFMHQYMVPSLSMEIIQSARIDGGKEFYIFNKIALPIMKPAIATQAIFAFVASWNNLFMPTVLIQDMGKYTMPMMISLMKGDFYKTNYGAVYLGLSMTVLPLFVVYFALSKYIIAGVSLGSVKG